MNFFINSFVMQNQRYNKNIFVMLILKITFIQRNIDPVYLPWKYDSPYLFKYIFNIIFIYYFNYISKIKTKWKLNIK